MHSTLVRLKRVRIPSGNGCIPPCNYEIKYYLEAKSPYIYKRILFGPVVRMRLVNGTSGFISELGELDRIDSYLDELIYFVI